MCDCSCNCDKNKPVTADAGTGTSEVMEIVSAKLDEVVSRLVSLEEGWMQDRAAALAREIIE